MGVFRLQRLPASTENTMATQTSRGLMPQVSVCHIVYKGEDRAKKIN